MANTILRAHLSLQQIVPERRHDLAKLGLRAMFAGTFANFMTAIIVAVLM